MTPGFFTAMVVILIAALGLSLEGRRLRDAEAERQASIERLASLNDDATTVLRLRSGNTASEDQRPTADVIALVNRVLTQAGIPTTRFAGCTPEGDAAMSGSTELRRQSVRLSLQALALADLGTFLATWRAENTVWTPVSIEINHGADEKAQTFDAQVVLAAVYHAAPKGSR